MLFEEPFPAHLVWPQPTSTGCRWACLYVRVHLGLEYIRLQSTRLPRAHEASTGMARGDKRRVKVAHALARQTFRLGLFEGTTGNDLTCQREEVSRERRQRSSSSSYFSLILSSGSRVLEAISNPRTTRPV